jgi:hypothetical protein
MDPRCFQHWPWNQKSESSAPQDLAHSEIFSKFFRQEQQVTVEIPKCLDGFVWTGVRVVTSEMDKLQWYPLGIVVPVDEPIVHTIFIKYGEWNIIPAAFTPEFIEQRGSPVVKLEFPSPVSGKIELLAQKLT